MSEPQSISFYRKTYSYRLLFQVFFFSKLINILGLPELKEPQLIVYNLFAVILDLSEMLECRNVYATRAYRTTPTQCRRGASRDSSTTALRATSR